MNYLLITIQLIVLLLARPAFAISYRTIENGLEYGTYALEGTAGTKLHLLKVDLKIFKVKVLAAASFKSKALSVKSFAEQSHALAAINANFFDLNSTPLGLVIADGRLINPPKNVSWWSALLLKGDRAEIRKILDGEDLKNFDNAVQTGPRLVIAGITPKLKEETSPKSAVGIDSKGNFVFVASEGSVEINELAKILATPEKKGGVGLANALNLDGGSSTQFFAKVGELNLYIPGPAQVPIALGVFRK